MVTTALRLLIVAALHWLTPPTDCYVRYRVAFDTTQPMSGAACSLMPGVVASVPFYWCEVWVPTRGLGNHMSCEQYDNEDPPPGVVWMKRTP